MDHDRFERRAEALAETLRLKAGARGRSLRTRLRRAGRLLSRPARRAGADILRAQGLAGHPKLWRLVQGPELDRAFRVVETHLDTLDPADRRKGALLGVAGTLVFNLILAAALIAALLVWRGVI